MPLPQEAQIREQIKVILSENDYTKLTLKSVRKMLEEALGLDLSASVKSIRGLLVEALASLESGQTSSANDNSFSAAANGNDEDSDSSDDDSSDDDDASNDQIKKKNKSVKVNEDDDYKMALALQNEERRSSSRAAKTSTQSKAKKPRKSAAKTNGQPKKTGGLQKPQLLSPALSDFFHGETEMARTEVVRQLWKYFKDHSLQDPKDKRFILCDARLKTIFQKDRINAFKMNQTLSNHLKSKTEVTSSSSSSSSAPAASSKKKAKLPVLSDELVAILETVVDHDAGDVKERAVGLKNIPRTLVVKHLWVYIKRNGLQNPAAKSTIINDDLMKSVFKVDQMTIFEMNKLLNDHVKYEEDDDDDE